LTEQSQDPLPWTKVENFGLKAVTSDVT